MILEITTGIVLGGLILQLIGGVARLLINWAYLKLQERRITKYLNEAKESLIKEPKLLGKAGEFQKAQNN